MDYSFILDWDTGPMCLTTYQLKQLIGKESQDMEKILFLLQSYGMKLGCTDQCNTYGDTPYFTKDIADFIDTLTLINNGLLRIPE